MSTAASKPTTPRRCARTTITAVRAASTMFVMAAMPGRLVTLLKPPRQGAFRTPCASERVLAGESVLVLRASKLAPQRKRGPQGAH
jgi:hypothetical protein